MVIHAKMVEEAKKAKTLPSGFFQILIALAIIIMSQGVGSVLVQFFFIIIGKDANFMDNNGTIVALYITIATIILTILYVVLIEQRSLYSMGFGLKHAVKDYIVGLAVGISMFSAVVGLLYVTNNLEYKMTMSFSPLIIVFLIGFLFQGASEEVVLRGYLMNSIGAKHNIILAVIINSSLFGVLHLLNDHVTFLSILNIILFGVFASVYALKFNNIWGVMAIHSAWNFFQGNIYGLPVSGLSMKTSLFQFKEVGRDYITGGGFGPEGGLSVTTVLLLSIIFVFFLNLKRNNS